MPGGSVGIGKNKSKSSSMTNQSSNYSKTSTPTNPDWVVNGAQDLVGRIMGAAGQDPSSFVAGVSPLQQHYFGLATGLGSNGMGMIGQAAQNAQAATETAPVSNAEAQTAYQGIGNYLNPYASYVAGNTLSGLDRARTMAQTGAGRDAVLAGQYGGSRQGVVDANLNRDFLGQVGSTLGNIYSGGFNTALGAADADANRAQQTSIFNASARNNAALAAQQAQLQSAGILGGLGQSGVSTLGDAAQAQYGINQAQAQAPLTLLQMLTGAYGALPLGLFQGNAESGTESSSSQTKGKQTGYSVEGSLSFPSK
jgi:hypothetical protein